MIELVQVLAVAEIWATLNDTKDKFKQNLEPIITNEKSKFHYVSVQILNACKLPKWIFICTELVPSFGS